MGVELYPHQEQARDSLANGRVLYGGVGSGKSLTAIAYYMKNEAPKDVYVITTAKKRDSLEWVGEASRFGLGTAPDGTVAGILRVDSWNNIQRYESVRDAFFIFDEQRLVGNGAWVKTFLKLARCNRWILLSATPGDTWLDYAPLFIANGWYANLYEFKRRHVLYQPFIKYPRVIGYLGEQRLERLRNELLVEMPHKSPAERIVNYIQVGYDKELLKKLQKERWNHEENRPITDVAELWRLARRAVNSHPSRLAEIRALLKIHPRLIVFYNFNYELEILRELRDEHEVREWNGHRHDPVPDGRSWVYLVQYTAGAEGWNCISTNATAFYSATYSYKAFTQAQGRIDRINTKYTELFYYVLESSAYIDSALRFAFDGKRDFNERHGAEEWEETGFSLERPK